jgi:hypothetical protein
MMASAAAAASVLLYLFLLFLANDVQGSRTLAWAKAKSIVATDTKKTAGKHVKKDEDIQTFVIRH